MAQVESIEDDGDDGMVLRSRYDSGCLIPESCSTRAGGSRNQFGERSPYFRGRL